MLVHHQIFNKRKMIVLKVAASDSYAAEPVKEEEYVTRTVTQYQYQHLDINTHGGVGIPLPFN